MVSSEKIQLLVFCLHFLILLQLVGYTQILLVYCSSDYLLAMLHHVKNILQHLHCVLNTQKQLITTFVKSGVCSVDAYWNQMTFFFLKWAGWLWVSPVKCRLGVKSWLIHTAEGWYAEAVLYLGEKSLLRLEH